MLEKLNDIPLVSIIMPVYNVEKYIVKSFLSAINQTYDNCEVIVVNDGTKDNSIELIRPYFRDNTILINQINGGLSSARNTGLQHASGEYIFFLDSDDWIEENCIEIMMNSFEKNVDIVQGSVNYVYENGRNTQKKLLKEAIIGQNNTLVKEYFYKQNLFICVWNKLYRKKTLENIRFFNGIVNEDVVFTFELCCMPLLIKNISTPIINYLQRDNSIVHKASLRSRMRMTIPLDMVIDQCKKNKSEFTDLAIFDKYISLLYLYIFARNGELEYNDEEFESLNEILNELGRNITINKLISRVSKKQLVMFILSKYSKNILCILFKRKG